jgi:DNA-binding winged helix-turn-helix (wHTH) protein
MASSAPEGTGSDCKLRFDIYEVDPLSGELRKHGVRIPLEERPFRALLILLRRANALVTREELQQQLWPSDTFVDFDHGLNTAIRKIRLALNDRASAPRFIETVGRRGYRFLPVVEQALHVASERTVAVDGAATTLAIAAPTAARLEHCEGAQTS